MVMPTLIEQEAAGLINPQVDTARYSHIFTLESLRSLIKVAPTWIIDQQNRATRVRRYRRYQEGTHDQNLTPNMKKMLRIHSAPQAESFALNYMDVVIQTMVDRINLQAIEGDTPDSTEWAQDVLESNRVDSMQHEVHEAAIRDGDSFVMVAYDNDEQEVIFTFEEAFDGTSGMLAVYRSANLTDMYAAIKVWHIDGEGEKGTDIITRVNIYYPGRIEKYFNINGGTLEPFVEPGQKGHILDWTLNDGTPIGIPVVHFRNSGRRNYGRSEIRDVTTAQDALNRFFYSSVMAAELTAFTIFIAKGFKPPSEIVPGSVITIGEAGMTAEESASTSFERIEPGDLSQLLSMWNQTRLNISLISRTPAPEFGGSDAGASGESLKQRESGLIGKAERFMVRAGNAWEDVMAMAWRVQAAYGIVSPPDYGRFYTRWRPAEIRSDKDTVDNALKMRPVMGDRYTLRAVAGVFELDEEAIENILEEKAAETEAQMAQMMVKMPGYADPNNPAAPTDKAGLVPTGEAEAMKNTGQEASPGAEGDTAEPMDMQMKSMPTKGKK